MSSKKSSKDKGLSYDLPSFLGGVDLSQHVSIIGGGMSGLLVGYRLKQARVPFTIFECDARVGGKIQTESLVKGKVESAANAILASDDVMDLLGDLKLIPLHPRPKLRRGIWRFDSIRRFPFSSLEFVKFIFNLFLKSPPRPNEDHSVHEVLAPLLGDRVCDEVVSAGLNGIYASSARELHFLSLFKCYPSAKSYWGFFKKIQTYRPPQKTKAQSLSFKGGMQDLVDALKRELSDSIEINSRIDKLPKNCIICTDAIEAAELVGGDIGDLLRELSYKSLYTCTVFTSKRVKALKRFFGVLRSNGPLYGVLANSEIYEHRVEPNNHSYTLIGEASPQALSELFSTSFQAEVDECNPTHWNRAIPLYDYSRYELITKIAKRLNGRNDLALFGNYVHSVSLRELCRLSKEISALGPEQ